MIKVSLLSSIFLSLLLFGSYSTSAQTVVPVRLKDVRTVYVDEGGFRFLFSSCATQVGKMVLPCPKHALERAKFLEAFKRWLTKSGFTLVDNKDDAEGIVQGTLSIDETDWRDDERQRDDPRIGKRKDHYETYRHSSNEPRWSVNAWLVNQDGRKLWTLGVYPQISYAGGLAKIEGKKLAKALEYDFKHSR